MRTEWRARRTTVSRRKASTRKNSATSVRISPDDLEDDLGDDLDEEDVDEDDEDEEVGEEDEGDGPEETASARPRPAGESESDEDEEEELDDDDVEASLDVILKERLVVEDEDEESDDEDEVVDVEDRSDGSGRVLPKQPGEFVCQSCFLVKSQTQLADRTRMLCRDCV